MVTRIRRGARPHLYIEEQMERFGLNDQKLGDRMGVSRTTVWRWRTEQHRLNSDKIANIAHHIGLDNAQALYHPPERQSIDAIMAEAAPEDYETVLEIARRLARRAS